MMAFSSTTYFPILLLILLSFLHVHARDGQFFSKISTNNNAKETTDQLLIPNKQEAPLNKQEQDPNFIPQNQQNTGYGLYSHESGQFPPATTTGNLPYKTESEESYNKEYYPNSNTNKENRQYYNNDAYFTDPQGMSDTRFMEKAYTSPITSSSSNNNNNNYYNGGNMYNSRQQGMGASKFSATNYGNKYNNGGNMYNYDKPAGMSDTRFLENGRYYYDLNSENYNLYANENSRGFESRNEYYNNRGYYGNNGNSLGSRSDYYNNRGQYANNENSYDINNSMEGYNQNQEEFQESQDEQFMP